MLWWRYLQWWGGGLRWYPKRSRTEGTAVGEMQGQVSMAHVLTSTIALTTGLTPKVCNRGYALSWLTVLLFTVGKGTALSSCGTQIQ